MSLPLIKDSLGSNGIVTLLVTLAVVLWPTASITVVVVSSLSHVQLFTIPWTVAHQDPLRDVPGMNTGVGCHFLLQVIFPTQGSNPRLLHWQLDSLPLSHQRSPYVCFTIEETKLQSWVTSQGFTAGKWLIQKLHKCLFNSKNYGLSLMCLIQR